jgi:hypothetical protein
LLIDPPAETDKLPELAIVPPLTTLLSAFKFKLKLERTPPCGDEITDVNIPPASTYISFASITALVTLGLVDSATNLPASTKLPLNCNVPVAAKLSNSFTPCGITKLDNDCDNPAVNDILPPTALPLPPSVSICTPPVSTWLAATYSAGVNIEEELTDWLDPPTFILIVFVRFKSAAETLA